MTRATGTRSLTERSKKLSARHCLAKAGTCKSIDSEAGLGTSLCARRFCRRDERNLWKKMLGGVSATQSGNGVQGFSGCYELGGVRSGAQ